VTPFTVAFTHATPHGVLTAVHIPDSPDPVPDSVLATLPAPEMEFARTQRGYRQVQFVGGRVALRESCLALGVRPGAILATSRGAPLVPTGLAGSVSHKSTLAIGMVAREAQGTLGVDLEDYGPPRLAIAPRVLTPAELAAIVEHPEDRRWFGVLVRFSLKESIYKALDPFVHRYVGFHEAEVTPDLHGGAAVALRLSPPPDADGAVRPVEGPFAVDARYEWLHGRLVTSVRIRRAGAP
jgi:enterobactin synthetase component D